MAILPRLVDEDFGYRVSGSGRWGKGIRHDSLVVDEYNDLFFWNSEGIYGGPLEYLTLVRKMNQDTAKKLLGMGNSFIEDKPTKKVDADVPYDKLVEFLRLNGVSTRDYWYKRGLQDETIDRFSLGYYEGWFTVPFYVRESLVNIQCRRDEPSKKILSWYKGHKPYLFNSDILNYIETVYITEGPIDAILLSQYGIPAVSHNGGANYWNNSWIEYFRKQKNIIYIADNDQVGRLAAQKVSRSLGEYRVKIYVFNDKPEKYDTVDFFRDGGTTSEFKERISTGSKYLFEGI